MRTAVFPSLLAAMLAACVAAEHPPRFDEQTVGQIETGKSTREDVLLTLGLPERTGQDGRTLYYQWIRSVAVAIIPTPYGVPAFGHISGEYLRVDFDAGGLVSNIVTREETLDIPFDITKATGYALALPEEDAAAKRFHADPLKCTIYLYVKRSGGDSFSSTTPAFLRIDRRHAGHVGGDSWYFRISLMPGMHTATILDARWDKVPRVAAPSWDLNNKAPKIKEELTFRCSAGDVDFIEIGYPALANYPSLREVDSEEGRAAIREGKLLIGQL